RQKSRTHYRPASHQHHLAADQRGVPVPDGERAPAGRHHPVGPERRLRVRSRMSTTMARMMELSSPLGKDLLFRELRGREELGRPAEFESTRISTPDDIKPSD